MESASQYANRALPKLFSETNSLMQRYRDILSKGGFLNADHIANIKAVYLEEMGDVHSLGVTVSHDFEKNAVAGERSVVELLEIRQKSELYVVSTQKRLQDVLAHTSVQMIFFGESIKFFEEYEKANGFAPISADQHAKVFAVLRTDYDYFRSQLELRMNHGMAMLHPFNFDFVSELNMTIQRGPETEGDSENPARYYELGKIALYRSLVAVDHRKELEALFKAFENCFAIIAKRAMAHKVNITLIQSLK